MISKIIPNGLFLGALASSGLLAFTTLLGTAGFKALDSLSALVRNYRAELIDYVKHLSLIEEKVNQLRSDHNELKRKSVIDNLDVKENTKTLEQLKASTEKELRIIKQENERISNVLRELQEARSETTDVVVQTAQMREAIQADIERFIKAKAEFNETLQTNIELLETKGKKMDSEMGMQKEAIGNMIDVGLKEISEKNNAVLEENLEKLKAFSEVTNQNIQNSILLLRKLYGKMIKAGKLSQVVSS